MPWLSDRTVNTFGAGVDGLHCIPHGSQIITDQAAQLPVIIDDQDTGQRFPGCGVGVVGFHGRNKGNPSVLVAVRLVGTERNRATIYACLTIFPARHIISLQRSTLMVSQRQGDGSPNVHEQHTPSILHENTQSHPAGAGPDGRNPHRNRPERGAPSASGRSGRPAADGLPIDGSPRHESRRHSGCRRNQERHESPTEARQEHRRSTDPG